MIIGKFVIIAELIRSQNSMAVIFLCSGVSHIQFVNSEDYNQKDNFENHRFILHTLKGFSS